MGDDAIGSTAFSRWHFPGVGGGLNEHFARRRTALAHIVLRLANALAAGGVVIAPYPLARRVLARCRIFPCHLRPVAFQFFGHHLREAGKGALPHLRTCNANDHGVIRFHDNPGIDFRCRIGGCRTGGAEAEREAAGGSSSADKEGATVKSQHLVHARLLTLSPLHGSLRAPADRCRSDRYW